MKTAIEEMNNLLNGKTIAKLKNFDNELIIQFTDDTEVHIDKTLTDDWVYLFFMNGNNNNSTKVRCNACDGSGKLGFQLESCWYCGGTGEINKENNINISHDKEEGK